MLEILDHLTMDRLLGAFSFEQVQTTLTMLDWLQQNGRTLEDIREYVKGYKYNHPKMSVGTGIVDPKGKYIPSVNKPSEGCGKKVGGYIMCGSCGHKTAKVFEVNTKPCNQIGGNFTQQIVCKNCEHEEYK